ncbi:MAG TPA: homoserine kinase [Thermofilum sp.]|nr:homoserine kinase [Thermofilum sp.]
MKSRARAYCSSANLGSGFDVLAVALDAYYDEVWAEAEPAEQTRVEVVEVVGPYSAGVPRESNTAQIAVESLMRKLNVYARVELGIWKGVPVGSGLGSSGAAAAAAVVAVIKALNLEVSRDIAAKAAGEGERGSAEEPHYDNSSASLFGGIAVIYSLDPLKVYSFSPTKELQFVIAIPRVDLGDKKTKKMRSVLPRSITLKSHVEASAKLAALILGLQLGDPELVGIGMKDYIVEPRRAPLIPAYHKAASYALEAGAAGISISGAGPSLIALCHDKSDPIRDALRTAYEEEGIAVDVKKTRPAPLRPWPPL